MSAEPKPRAPSEKGLPASWDLERSVLGGLMLAPEYLDTVRELLTPEHFHRPAHAQLFGLLLEMSDARMGIDVAGVAEQVMAREVTEKVGGVAYVFGLPQANASVETIPPHARRVADLAMRRRYILALRAAEERALVEAAVGTEELIDGAQSELYAVLDGRAQAKGWQHQGEVVFRVLEEVRARIENPTDCPGMRCGFPDLDKKLGGFRTGKLYILAGRPAMGKSLVAQLLAENVARGGDGVGIITLEMPDIEVGERAIVQASRVPGQAIRDGRVSPDDYRRLLEAAEDLSRLSVWIDDSPAASIAQIRAKARRLKQQHPELKLLVLDYLQLATADGPKGQSRQQEVGKISRGLKALAKELDIAVLALAQLSRACEQRTDKRPMPSDLREAGDLEQDADVILFVYRDEVYNPDSPKRGIAEIIIGKHRGGSLGTVELAFLGATYSVQSLAQSDVGGGYY